MPGHYGLLGELEREKRGHNPGMGFEARKRLRGQTKVAAVMREFHAGRLHLPEAQGGGLVTDEDQAKAIAMSEAGLSRA